MGIFAFFAGYPTTNKTNGFSFLGLFKILFKKFIGLGVCVSIANPEKCKHEINIPVAIPTDSFT